MGSLVDHIDMEVSGRTSKAEQTFGHSLTELMVHDAGLDKYETIWDLKKGSLLFAFIYGS